MCLKCPSKDLHDPHSIEEGRALERGGGTAPPSHKSIYNTTSTECKTLKGERRLINGICRYILICGYCTMSGVSVSVRTHYIPEKIFFSFVLFCFPSKPPQVKKVTLVE